MRIEIAVSDLAIVVDIVVGIVEILTCDFSPGKGPFFCPPLAALSGFLFHLHSSRTARHNNEL
jgi:hypothetical protein